MSIVDRFAGRGGNADCMSDYGERSGRARGIHVRMRDRNSALKIVPVDPEIASAVRRERRDSFGNALAVRRDDARHQCRSCLELTRPGEGFILFAHRPFAGPQPYAEVGPVFIHERECRPYGDAGSYPPEFPRTNVVLRAYGETDEIVDARLVTLHPVEEVIAELFEDPSVSYLHARNAAYGCFMFRIERTEPRAVASGSTARR